MNEMRDNETWKDYNLLLKTSMEKVMIIYFAIVFLFGFGPGTLLVNRPGMALGIPILYLWLLVWAILAIIGLWIINFRMMGIDKNMTIDVEN